MAWFKLDLSIALVRARRGGPALALGVLWLVAQAGALASGGGLAPADGAVVFARGQVATVKTWELAGDQGLKAVDVSGGTVEFAANNLLCLDAGLVSALAPAPRVLLRNGESINARLAAGSTGKRLVFESPLLGKLEADTGDVAAYQALGQAQEAGQPSTDLGGPVKGEGPAGTRPEAKDGPAPPFVLLKNGDLIASGIEGVNAAQVSINTEFGQTQIPLETISAVVLSADPPPFDGRREKQSLVELADGQRLYCDRVTQTAGRVVLTRGPGEGRVDPSAVRRIVWPGATIAYLSERSSKSEGRSYFGRPVEPRRDHNALGGPLRIDNSWFSRGLGMRPRSRCVFEPLTEPPGSAKGQANASWLYLAGFVGMDPMLGRSGNCEIAVNVDGKAAVKDSLRGGQHLSNPGESAAGRPIRRLLVPVSGAGQIELQVDFGPDGDLGDYVNWCDLLLVGQPLTDSRGSVKGQQRGAGRP
jgi:hypothetical protein